MSQITPTIRPPIAVPPEYQVVVTVTTKLNRPRYLQRTNSALLASIICHRATWYGNLSALLLGNVPTLPADQDPTAQSRIMAAVYSNMHTSEELANLFARQFTLNQVTQPTPAPAPVPVPAQEPVQAPKIVYISQHYNHSAHLARQNAQQQQQQQQQAQSVQRPASEPPQSENAVVERVLREHSVDPSGLSQAQIQLFKTVEDPEKLRLIEIWRACPPTNSNDNPTLGWAITTVEQEQTLARIRWEQKQQQQMQAQEVAMSLDGTPLTPIQPSESKWLETYGSYMEPYMIDGYLNYEERARREYEESARRALAESTQPAKETFINQQPLASAAPSVDTTFSGRLSRASDPVYKTTNVGMESDWGQRKQQEQEQAMMADQYGMLMAMRGSEDEMML